MTPRDVLAMIAAKREAQREDRRYSDMLQARQTANIGNLLYGTEKEPFPVKPDQCTAFNWDRVPDQPVAESEDDDEIDQELLMQQSMIMRGMIRRKGGNDGSN
jgi:hypothetical protein